MSREEAVARFEAAFVSAADPRGGTRLLAQALGCKAADDVVAPIDLPPFDRSYVDGFAVRAADTAARRRAYTDASGAEQGGARLRYRAGADGAADKGDGDCNRRSGAARRGR